MDPHVRRLGWGWWALAFMLLAAGVFVAHRWVTWRGPWPEQAAAVFTAQCYQIRRGMTPAEVGRIFGRPGEPEPLGPGILQMDRRDWRHDSRKVVVCFAGDHGAIAASLFEADGQWTILPLSD